MIPVRRLFAAALPRVGATSVALPSSSISSSIWSRTLAPSLSVAPSLRAASSASLGNSPDNNYIEDRVATTDGDSKRAFTYFMLGSARFIYASAARLAVIKGIATLSASADVLALASLEVDLSSIDEGNCVTVKWRGKPVFIKHRSEEDITRCQNEDFSGFRDPQSDESRVQNPKWLIVLGVCTHLGCVPIPNAGDYHGWFCPCHASHYDGSGRIRQGPAPLNLEVPPYSFLEDDRVLIG